MSTNVAHMPVIQGSKLVPLCRLHNDKQLASRSFFATPAAFVENKYNYARCKHCEAAYFHPWHF